MSGGRRGEEGRIPVPTGAWRSLFHIPTSLSSPVGIPTVTPGQPVSPGCSGRQFWVQGGGAWLPTPMGGSLSPRVSIRDARDHPGLALPTAGMGSGQADRAESQCRRHPAISQHTPAWDMVVSALLPQKGSFLALRDTNVPMFFVPPHPLGTSGPLALRNGGRRCTAPQ